MIACQPSREAHLPIRPVSTQDRPRLYGTTRSSAHWPRASQDLGDHRGVLFLDELPEFRRNAIEALRPTMESGRAVVVRARERIVMPAKPLLVAAMNPCPCGLGSW